MAYEDLLKDTSVISEDGNYFTLTLTDLEPNTSYPIELRWKYKDGTFSGWSAVRRLPAYSLAPEPSELPSTPTVKPVVGAIELAWNGKTSTGEDQPYGFNSAKVYIGTDSNFTPIDSGTSKNLVDILNFADKQNIINIGVETIVNSSLTLDYGVDYFVKIKTTNGNAAQDSTAVAATGNPVRIGQLDNNGLVTISADKIITGTLRAGASITAGAVNGKRVILSSGENPIQVYGSAGTLDPLFNLNSLGNLEVKGIINAIGGSFGKPGLEMKIGFAVNTVGGNTYDGIYMGTNNYWYSDGIFKVGDNDKNLSFENGNLSLVNKGTVSDLNFGTQNVTTTLNTNGLLSIISDGDSLYDWTTAGISVETQVKHVNIYPGSITISLDDSDPNQTEFTGSSFSIYNDGAGYAVLQYDTLATSDTSGVKWANYNWGSSTQVNQFMWGRQSLSSDAIRSIVVDSTGIQWVGPRNFYGNNSSTTMSNTTIGVDGDFYFSTNEN